MPTTRRQFLAKSIVGMGAIAAIESIWREPQHSVVKEVEVHLLRLPEAFDGFRIAQFSDIHFGPYMDQARLRRGVQLAQPFRPDLVALTGDFVSPPFGRLAGVQGAHHAEPLADVFAEWKGTNIVACLGNHDHWNGPDIVQAALEHRGVTVLRNKNYALERGSARLWIAGVDDVFERKADLAKTLIGIPPGEFTLLLSHEPDFADETAEYPVDLQLSGHSHGGQVRVPGYGPIILPPLGEKYHSGLNRVGGLQVYTNWGLGVINPPVRMFCLPEVTLMTLRVGLPKFAK